MSDAHQVLIVDTETTSLDVTCGQIWEVAAVLYDSDERRTLVEVSWQLPVDLDDPEGVDPAALKIGDFHRRRLPDDQLADPAEFAQEFVRLSSGLPIVGANPSFDTQRLERLLWRHGEEPRWHYRPICVEALAVGYLRGYAAAGSESHPPATRSVPWSAIEISKAIGCPRPQAHSALGDALWALSIWRKVYEG